MAQATPELERTLALAAHPKGMSYRATAPLFLSVLRVDSSLDGIGLYRADGKTKYRGRLLAGDRVSMEKGDLLQVFITCEQGRECGTTEMAVTGSARYHPTPEGSDIPLVRVGDGLDVASALARGLAPSSKEAAEAEGSLQKGVDTLVKQIMASLQKEERFRLAVVDFTHLDQSSSDFGRYLSERVITLFFGSKRFQVIERNQLKKVMAEQKLSLSDLVDPKAGTRLGKLLGADVIATGTIADLGEMVEVNARLINTNSGEVFAVATRTFRATPALRKLMLKRYKSLE